MTNPDSRPLRLWPGVTLLVVQWLATAVVPLVLTGMAAGFTAVGGSVLGGLAIVVWWAFFSRARHADRWGVLALIIVAALVTWQLLHPSVKGAMMGMMFPFFSPPHVCLALVGGAALARRVPGGKRFLVMTTLILLVFAGWTLVRTEGMSGEGDSAIRFRWSPTAEDRLLAEQGDDRPDVSAAALAAEDAVVWPGFRGADRDGVVTGTRLATDWSSAPPVELWRRPVGPGWSSFAVAGDRLYTQEQRGDDEVVSCYSASTGEPVWSHRDAARFYESNAGPGPRATPTLSEGRVYTQGGTGIVNALDAADGSVVWSRDAIADTGKQIPGWGIAGSPLVVDDLVVVATTGALVAYDRATGAPRWFGPKRGWGYSSPHLATLGGVRQIVLLNGAGAIGVAPADGALLWQHEWETDGIVQPGVIDGGGVLIGSGSGLSQSGLRRIGIEQAGGTWTAAERWTTIGLKPYFSDYVVHDGQAYGFDGSILACVDLADGKRRWKGGRYGHGQLLLLAEQDLLLVLSEQGELALVAARPDSFAEIARVPAITGKTWNHPVLAGDLLFVRNAEEMAAFRLAAAPGS